MCALCLLPCSFFFLFSIRDVLDKLGRGLPPGAALRVFRDAARGMDFLHRYATQFSRCHDLKDLHLPLPLHLPPQSVPRCRQGHGLPAQVRHSDVRWVCFSDCPPAETLLRYSTVEVQLEMQGCHSDSLCIYGTANYALMHCVRALCMYNEHMLPSSTLKPNTQPRLCVVCVCLLVQEGHCAQRSQGSQPSH